MMFKLPIEWFKDEVSYISTTNSSAWGNDADKVELTVTGVRVGSNQATRRGNSNHADTSSAVLYAIPERSSFTTFEKGGTIVYNGQEYVISKVHRFEMPTSNELHHVKLELI